MILTQSQLVYAGFWRRFFATVIDYVLLLTLLLPIFLLIYGLPLTISSVTKSLVFNLVWLFAVISFWSATGSTPGKRLLNCKIVKINKEDNSVAKLTVVTSILRAFACILSALPYFVGFFWIGVDKKKRALHDIVLSTAVIIDEENYEEIPLKSLMAFFPK